MFLSGFEEFSQSFLVSEQSLLNAYFEYLYGFSKLVSIAIAVGQEV